MQPIRSRRVPNQQPATDAAPRRRWVPIDEAMQVWEAAQRDRSRRELYSLVQVPAAPPRPSRTRRWDREEERNA